MRRNRDKLDVDDAKWQDAVAREAIIRPLARVTRLSPVDVATACRILGLRRSRLYALVERYRTAPVTSSLASATPGPKKRSRRLSDELEAVIEEAIRDKYLTRQKVSVSVLHDHVRHLCRARGLAIPSWKAVRARVDQIDRHRLVSGREGGKTTRDRLKPVVQEYRAEKAIAALRRMAVPTVRVCFWLTLMLLHSP